MYGAVRLMHKNDKVCDLTINRSNQVERVSNLSDHARRFLPPGISDAEGRDLRIEFTRWLRSRIFSPARTDIMEMQPFLTWEVLAQAGKISLMDTYWFKKTNAETWDRINPFHNWNCQHDPVCLLNLKPEYVEKDRAIISPNLAIPGVENTFFYSNGKKFFLLMPDVKKEMKYYKMNSDNPVVARRFYTIVSDRLFVAKETETSEDIEAFPLSELYIASEGFAPRNISGIYHCLQQYGIGKNEATDFLQYVQEADEAYGGEKTELESIYLLRDANTLETIGFAKI